MDHCGSLPMPSIESRVHEMTVYAKTLPESRIHSDDQLANLVYDIVKKTFGYSYMGYIMVGKNYEIEQVSSEIRKLYNTTMY